MNKIDQINSSFSINTEKLIFIYLFAFVCVYVCETGWKRDK